MINLRPLTLTDLDTVIAVEHAVPDSLAWEPATKEDQESLIARGNIFGIFEDEKLIGKVGFIDKGNEGWQVDGLIIDKQRRGKKYGEKLFEYAIHEIMKTNLTIIFLFVYPKNSTAIGIYLKSGFIIDEYIQNKYGPGKDRLKMIKIIQ